MNLDQATNIAEIAALIATIVTLAYLAGYSNLGFTDWQLGLSDKDSFESTSQDFFRMLKTSGRKEYWRRHGTTADKKFYNYKNREVYASDPPVFVPDTVNRENKRKRDAVDDTLL